MSMARVDQIIINESCIGCGKCVKSCFTDVLRMNPETKRPEAKYLEECEWCLVCEEQCPVNAIYVKPHIPVKIPHSF